MDNEYKNFNTIGFYTGYCGSPFRREGKETCFKCPKCNGEKREIYVSPSGQWKCHHAKCAGESGCSSQKGGPRQFLALVKPGLSDPEAFEELNKFGRNSKNPLPEKAIPEKKKTWKTLDEMTASMPKWSNVSGKIGKSSKVSGLWKYHFPDGKPAFAVVRLDGSSGKIYMQAHPVSGGWQTGGIESDRPLYRLSDLPKDLAIPVIVVEGEKCADALQSFLDSNDFKAWVTTPSQGAQSPQKTDWSTLAGRSITILPDNDQAGAGFAQTVAQLAKEIGASRVAVGKPFGKPDTGDDIADEIKRDGDPAEILTTIKNTEEVNHEEKTVPAKSPKLNDSEILIKSMSDSLEFFRDDMDIWATVPVSGVKQNMPVKSSSFKRWLRAESLRILGKHIGAETAQKVSENLEAIATYDQKVLEKPLFVRLGHHNGKIYFDLVDDQWRVVEIDRDGWRVVTNPPVKFRRMQGMKPLPIPTPGGKISDLRPLINAFNEDIWVLSVAWIIGALHPTGPYPILIFQGEQGTAKTTMSTLMRDLVDPSKASLRTVPREPKDIFIAANNGLVVAFDNLSGVPDWLSDLFCRISTGGGFSSRSLYTDSDETIINVKRPQILNGIDDVAHRGDLRDRSLILNLEPIPNEKRKREREIQKDYNRLRPGIMGAIFDAVSTAIRNRENTEVANLPRMADFAAWIVAAEPSLPWDAGKFLEIYRESACIAIEAALEGSPVAVCVRKLLDKRSVWVGCLSELLTELNGIVSDSMRDSRAWPKDSIRLSKAIKRIATELRSVGIDVSFSRDKKSRQVILKKGDVNIGHESGLAQ